MSEQKTLPLKDYVIVRRLEILDEMVILRARLADLERERHQIEALSTGNMASFSPAATSPEYSAGYSKAESSGKITIKQAVLMTLERFPEGLRIQELIQRLILTSL